MVRNLVLASCRLWLMQFRAGESETVHFPNRFTPPLPSLYMVNNLTPLNSVMKCAFNTVLDCYHFVNVHVLDLGIVILVFL